MIHRLPRALAAAGLGASAVVALLVFLHLIGPGATLDMIGERPGVMRGFYPAEETPEGLTFQWTRQSADVRLDGADRRVDWIAIVRLRGGRPDPSTLPEVTFSIGGVVSRRVRSGNDFQDVVVPIPAEARGERGFTLLITTSNTFVPGPGDPRELGVVVDRIKIMPAAGATVLPPRRALAGATGAVALLGAALGLIGLTLGTAVLAAVLIALGHALAVCRDVGPYSPYALQVIWIAVWIAVALVAEVWGIERALGRALRGTARFVAAFTAGAIYLKLLILLHPALPVGDAVFQAHRFEWVLAGRFFFTSLAPGLYEFPYAIGFYLFSAPFSWTTRNDVALLRIVAACVDALAGVLLYSMIVRSWGNRLAGAMATAVYHLIPLNFAVQTVGNLTNAFAQSVAVMAIYGVTSGTLRVEHRGITILVTLVTLGAFLSHTSTLAILFTTMIAVALLFWLRGGPALASAAQAVTIVAIGGLTIAILIYHPHFGAVYRQ
ncbi:MAG: hypothetical protein ACRDF6_10190, partial [bacterium]